MLCVFCGVDCGELVTLAVISGTPRWSESSTRSTDVEWLEEAEKGRDGEREVKTERERWEREGDGE